MKIRRILLVAVASTLLLALSLGAVMALRPSAQGPALGAISVRSESGTASLLHFSLAEMTQRADKIFRGTVVDVEPGTVPAGGGELPIVIYRLRVDQAFKGAFDSKGDVQFVEIRMVGDLKGTPSRDGLKKLSAIPQPPHLLMGRDYLLLTTPPSAIGLSTTVGLGQGSFEIFALDKVDWAVNEFNNAGLYDGPVPYEKLASQIQELVSQ